MPRSYRSRVQCHNCGNDTTTETNFERWMRNNRLLDTSEGIVRFDLDVLVHRYKDLTDKMGDRTVQAIMFVEVKTWGAECTDAQLDTLGLFSQVLKNRRANRHANKPGRHAGGHVPLARCYSHVRGEEVGLRMFGGHLLRLERDTPGDGWLEWDRKPITSDQLVQLLRFDLDPTSLRPIDWRRRTYTVDGDKMAGPGQDCPLFDTSDCA